MSPQHRYFLSCDWGTTHFRLRLVDGREEKITGAVETNDGVAALHEAWESSSEVRGSRQDYFLRVLGASLQDVLPEDEEAFREVPIVISGMAGSTIGLVDLPYADLPFSLTGEALVYKEIRGGEGIENDLFVLSGVRDEEDVMRGEETELVGLWPHVEPKKDYMLFLFPGTHSKHIRVQDGRVTSFSTHMTGEVFAAMTDHTVLSDSVREASLDEETADAFVRGVRDGASGHPLLNRLFRIRARTVLGDAGAEESYQYLSGLLIGHELSALPEEGELQIVLCAGRHLQASYETALMTLDSEAEVHVLHPELVDRAAALGHAQFLSRHLGDASGAL